MIACELKKWHCQLPAAACCSFHIALSELCDISLEMLTSCNCIRRFQFGEVRQCPQCLLRTQWDAKNKRFICPLCDYCVSNSEDNMDPGSRHTIDDCLDASSNPHHHSIDSVSDKLNVGGTKETSSKQCSAVGENAADFTAPKELDVCETSRKPAFHDDSVSSRDTKPAQNIAAEPAVHVTFKPTPVAAKKLSLTTMLLKWCYPPSMSECCTFHSALQDLRSK